MKIETSCLRLGRLCLLLLTGFLLNTSLIAQETRTVYLSGTDKDHTVQWDFYCSKGQNSGKWTKIAVPSNWELQGFGKYSYGYDNRRDSTLADEQGLYKHRFQVDKSWKDKRIFIVFEGSMTETAVKINGKTVGPAHQGGFTRFSYEIGSFTKTGENLLEVTVNKSSGNKSLNVAERQGDFWALGGIYRPVYLEVVPQHFINRIAVDAKADGTFLAEVFSEKTDESYQIQAQVETLTAEKVGTPFSVKGSPGEKVILTNHFDHIKTWTAEFPNLYRVRVDLKDAAGNIVHSLSKQFGFRSVEVKKHDGIYVNGKRVMLKGSNRHTIWPETGRTTSKELSITDVRLMKEMNMNAVRMSHYPPDQHFLDVCDSLGLYVLDELTGWQAKYDTEVGRKLLKELVIRDVNHPSVLFWDNGNEGGWNTELDHDYQLYDPQKRSVLHPWERFNEFDTKHYITYDYLVNSALYDTEILMPTEFMHGLFDGGHGAGLDDFWELMLRHPHASGGFLWSFTDEGVVRTDKNGIIDVYGNNAPDGLLGPHREKEASFYTVKEIWSPVRITKSLISAGFEGKLEVENHYSFTDLNQCDFTWKLVRFPDPKQNGLIGEQSGKPDKISLKPGEKGYLNLNLPVNWKESDALYLTATDPHGAEIYTWSWTTQSAEDRKPVWEKITGKGAISANETDEILKVESDGITCNFDKKSGFLTKVNTSKTEISLSNGPSLAGVSLDLQSFKHFKAEQNYVVELSYAKDKNWFKVTWTFIPGQPARLDYQYSQRGEADFMGISFNYPEEKIEGMKWLGRGPYRVWKNRLKGNKLGVWEKKYNNTVTGESWQYPEFKGYHSDVQWVVVENKEKPFTVYSENEHTFLQMLRPEKPKNAPNDYTSPAFPSGNISFLQAISPIGTKFNSAAVMGPQSQKNSMRNYTPVKGTLWFDFR